MEVGPAAPIEDTKGAMNRLGGLARLAARYISKESIADGLSQGSVLSTQVCDRSTIRFSEVLCDTQD